MRISLQRWNSIKFSACEEKTEEEKKMYLKLLQTCNLRILLCSVIKNSLVNREIFPTASEIWWNGGEWKCFRVAQKHLFIKPEYSKDPRFGGICNARFLQQLQLYTVLLLYMFLEGCLVAWHVKFGQGLQKTLVFLDFIVESLHVLPWRLPISSHQSQWY